MLFLSTDIVTNFSCTIPFEAVALSSSILLYSFLNLSSSSFSIGNSIVSSKSILFNLLLIIVILVVAPVSNEFNNSEYSKNIASLSSLLATA